MRTGPIRDGETVLEAGRPFQLLPSGRPGDESGVATTVTQLSDLVEPESQVFLADGQIILQVVKTQDNVVHTEVIRGGTLRSGKGMHIPGVEAKVPAFTGADEEALRTAIDIGVDLVGVSFVRTPEDVERVKRKISPAGHPPTVVAKIETRAAVDNLDDIVRVADAAMIARGDLGIQIPFREVPLLQKDIIRLCNEAGKPVITATQMLESMTELPLPTRAEVNDVANAVLDGTDAIMLSEETAVGAYPVEAVRVMSEIAFEAESRGGRLPTTAMLSDDPVSWAVARAAVQASEELEVAAILCPTRTGDTARRVAAFRPSMPVLAVDHSAETLRPLALVWGVVPFEVAFLPDEEVVVGGVERALAAARSSGFARAGDLITLVAGGSPPRTASTDVVRFLTL